MRICPKCGSENADADAFCKSCGAALASPAPAGKTESGKGAKGGKNAPKRELFVDPDEQIVASIGSSYLQNFLADRTVRRSVGILTQKRFYFKGRNFGGAGKNVSASTEEGVVPIENICYSKLVYTRMVGFLILGALFVLLAMYVPIIFNVMDEIDSDLWPWLTAMMALVAIIFFIGYYASRQTLFLIYFSEGCFGFDARFYTLNEIREFQRQLHAQMEKVKTQEKQE